MINFPNSKVNLGLNIIEKRPDGYHNLETVFYPVKLQDALEVTTVGNSRQECSLHVAGTPVAGNPEDNLVVKAYKLLKAEHALPSVHIYMYKHIPCGAGLGGGSADAAFMIKLLNLKYNLNLSDEKMEEYAARLGADCAFFIRNKPVFASGIGNVFEPIEVSLKGYYIVLIKPDIFVSTREAFALVKPQRPKISIKEIIRKPIKNWKEELKNDFETSVFQQYPEIGKLKEQLYQMGALYASMSGSGSSVFGIFKDQLEDIDKRFPGCFCRQREMD